MTRKNNIAAISFQMIKRRNIQIYYLLIYFAKFMYC